MTRRTVHVLLIAGAVLLAGCAGGVPGSPASPAADESPTAGESAPANQTTDGTQASDGTRTSTPAEAPEDGTVAFYLSDEENAIGDFRHLNVTVTRVGFEQAAATGGGWVERKVNDTTVDLTELQGANATLVEEYDLPNGTYGKVFVHVGAVNATLENGEQVRVKLPSQKLQLTKTFTVGNGSGVNFVFDITVHKAGNSGKYILKPVVSESGTDVPIRPTDDDEAEDEEEDELSVQFVTNVSQGENATLSVTRNGSGVANATVTVNDERVGTTDADGRLTVEVPNAEELEVEVEHGDEDGELEREFESEDEEESDEGDEGDEDTDGEEDEEDEKHDETALNATFVGNVSQGENATLSVTRNGSGVANATVTVNDERVGTTDADGELTFEVPTTEELTVVVRADGEDVELEREFEGE